MIDDNAFPETKLAPNGAAPTAFIMHHTAGRGDPASVVNGWQNDGRGYGAQYIMDRDGVIHDTQKEFGYNGYYEILPGEGQYSNLNNHDTVGMEIVANNDADVTPAQAQAAAQFIQARYPNTPVFGHGQVNPGHKEATEGATAVAAVNALRGGDSGAVASGSSPHPMVGGGASGGGDATAAQLASDMMQKYGLTREQAMGAVGVMGYESGNFRVMQEQNLQGGQGGLGYAQWTGPRRTDFENYTRQNNLDPSSYAANWGMIQHEIATNPHYAQAITALKQTGTVEDAARSWETNYEGMTPGGPGAPAFEQHIARAVDYNNRLPRDLSTVASAGSAGAGTAAGAAAGAAAPVYQPPSPMQTLGQQLGQAFASMGGGGGGGGAPPIQDAPDQPAIRSMAAMTDFMPSAPNPVPAQYAGGGIGSQLGALAAQPAPSSLENPQDAPSITAGAPSMTSMLGDLGTTATPGLFDNRGGNQLTPNPYRRIMRLS